MRRTMRQGAALALWWLCTAVQAALPEGAAPERVALRLDLDPAAADFSGEATISLRVTKRLPALVLHARQLQATALRLEGPGGRHPLVLKADESHDTWTLTRADGKPIAPGRWRAVLAWRGKVQTSGEGLYVAPHRVGGQPARMLATQLEAISARQVMPSFDEPRFRAPYQLEVRAPKDFEVASNTPVQSVKVEGERRLHRFAPTPPMQSYLLALTVGRFDVVEGRAGKVALRILTPPGKGESGRYALQATQALLPWLGDFFGTPYALPKLDQLAVPGTRQGAMEDWGLISYNESLLLFDPARQSPEAQRRVFSVMAHEIAHQWFGNLVSPASWTDIWLNEAFATWMERKAERHFHPEWQTDLDTQDRLAHSMARDATPATRAIRSGPVGERSVFEVFDDITYNKGGAVLAMLEAWIGEDAFRRGLASYMRDRAFRTATAEDLWRHIGRAAGQPVQAVVTAWTDRPGVPLVQVDARCEAGRTRITLRQERFSRGEPLPGTPWPVPLVLARGDERKTLLFDRAEAALDRPGCSPEPLRANAGGQGYYRVQYAPALAAALQAAYARLPASDQMALLSDQYALAEAGRIPMADAVALWSALPSVNGPGRAALFSAALDRWETLQFDLHGTPAAAALRDRALPVFAAELQRLGWTPAAGEDSQTQGLRGRLVRRLAESGQASTLAGARERFAAALAPDGNVPPSLRRAVLAAVGSAPTDAEFDALLNALHAADTEERRWHLVEALTAGTDAARAARLLDQTLSESVSPNVAQGLIGGIGERPELGGQARDFVFAHWEVLARRIGEGPFGGRHWLLPSVFETATTSAEADRLLSEQARLDGPEGASTARNAAERIRARERLRQREGERLAADLR